MKVEQKSLIFSAIINFLVAVLKIVSGSMMGLATLIADGFYTASDFITDILAIVGAKVGKRRPSKRYPLGFGSFENIMQIIMGFMILLVGSVVLFLSFTLSYSKPNLLVLIPLLIAIGLKFYSSRMLLMVGKRINSSMLVTSSKESFLDVISSLLIILVVFIGFIFPEIDKIASIIIAGLIIYQAIKIIYQNILVVIGEATKNEKIEKALEDIFSKYRKIRLNDATIIKQGPFYNLILNININKDYTVASLIKAEMNIKQEIKKKRLKVRLIDFDIDSKIRN